MTISSILLGPVVPEKDINAYGEAALRGFCLSAITAVSVYYGVQSGNPFCWAGAAFFGLVTIGEVLFSLTSLICAAIKETK